MNNFDLILRPVVSEKATGLEKHGKYEFFVHPDATKVGIKAVFKKLYGVDAVKVNVMNTAKKTKMGARRPITKRQEFKKVIVTTKGKKVVDISKPKLKA